MTAGPGQAPVEGWRSRALEHTGSKGFLSAGAEKFPQPEPGTVLEIKAGKIDSGSKARGRERRDLAPKAPPRKTRLQIALLPTCAPTPPRFGPPACSPHQGGEKTCGWGAKAPRNPDRLPPPGSFKSIQNHKLGKAARNGLIQPLQLQTGTPRQRQTDALNPYTIPGTVCCSFPEFFCLKFIINPGKVVSLIVPFFRGRNRSSKKSNDLPKRHIVKAEGIAFEPMSEGLCRPHVTHGTLLPSPAIFSSFGEEETEVQRGYFAHVYTTSSRQKLYLNSGLADPNAQMLSIMSAFL